MNLDLKNAYMYNIIWTIIFELTLENLREESNLVDSVVGTVDGSVLSLADSETKNANGTSHRHTVNTART